MPNNKWVLKLSSLFFVQQESIIEFLIQYNESERKRSNLSVVDENLWKLGERLGNWNKRVNWVNTESIYLQSFECRGHLMGEVDAREIYSKLHEQIVSAADSMPAKALERSLRLWWFRPCTQSRLAASMKAHQCHVVQSPPASVRSYRLLGKRDQNEIKNAARPFAKVHQTVNNYHWTLHKNMVSWLPKSPCGRLWFLPQLTI